MIQGVFFHEYLGSPLAYYYFAGAIHQMQNGYEGHLTDIFGYSLLTEIQVTKYEVSFIKMYEGRIDPIKYTLNKKPGTELWTGTYEGEKAGSDQVNCIITEVHIDFLSLSERKVCRQFHGLDEVGVGAHDHPLNQR